MPSRGMKFCSSALHWTCLYSAGLQNQHQVRVGVRWRIWRPQEWTCFLCQIRQGCPFVMLARFSFSISTAWPTGHFLKVFFFAACMFLGSNPPTAFVLYFYVSASAVSVYNVSQGNPSHCHQHLFSPEMLHLFLFLQMLPVLLSVPGIFCSVSTFLQLFNVHILFALLYCSFWQ